MKKFSYLLFMLVPALLLTGCKYDDDDLWNKVDDLDERVAAIEQWQTTVNGNITTLQGLVAALQNNDYVTGVTSFDTPAPGGYKITFHKSGEATIWNGANGTKGDKGDDAIAPEIGVKQDTDGKYYWTLDGEFIEASGQKMPVTGDKGDPGTPGTAGIIPKLRINTATNYWEVSYDNGSNWASLNVRATGEKGATGAKGDQGDAIFAKNGVDSANPDYVVFTLANNSGTITLPKYKSIGISFDQPEVFAVGESIPVGFTLDGEEPAIITVVNLPSGWKAEVDKVEKKITITAALNLDDENSSGEAIVILSDGGERTAVRTLLLEADQAIYRIGDYWPDRNVTFSSAGVVDQGTAPEGVVIWLDPASGGKNGKIVSIDELIDDSNLNFLHIVQWNTHYNSQSIQTGATDEYDGRANMQTLEAYLAGLDNTYNCSWNNFPAFNWVITKNGAAGTGGKWYLPAFYELQAMYAAFCGIDYEEIKGTWTEYASSMPNYNSAECQQARLRFNARLTEAGGIPLSTEDVYALPEKSSAYWSSTEISQEKVEELKANGRTVAIYCAAAVTNRAGGITSYSNKSNRFHARAIAVF